MYCVQVRPAWAQGAELRRQLVAQRGVDPDEIFQQHAKTCSLDEVFDVSGALLSPPYCSEIMFSSLQNLWSFTLLEVLVRNTSFPDHAKTSPLI